MTERSNRQMAARLRRAKLKQSANAEDIDFRTPRGLDSSMVQSLLAGTWPTRLFDATLPVRHQIFRHVEVGRPMNRRDFSPLRG